MNIEILLVDDQFLILESIKAILEPELKIKVVGTACDGKSAIALVKKLRPNILLMDIEMPNMNGILATQYIRKYFPDTKVIVLTSHKDQDYIAEALLAGASGYLWKGNLIKDLKQEIYSFGQGYSGVKAKLLTQPQSQASKETSRELPIQTIQKNSLTNTIKYRGKTIYLRKYRKTIYQPVVNQKPCKTCPTQANLNIEKARSYSIFKPFNIKKIRAKNVKTFSFQSIYSSPRFNCRKYPKRKISFLLEIASIVLLIIIF